MRMMRIMIAAAILCVMARPAGAEDFWGRKMANQPTNFIFGYGSLINTASRNATASKPVIAVPIRIAAAFGYVRCWCDRSPSGFTALGLRRLPPGESGMTINGVLYPVEGNDMAAFDARESGYVRLEVPCDMIEAVSWQRLPEQGRIWVYVPAAEGREPGEGLPTPNSRFPLLESYIDVVVEGGMEYGPDYAREIIATTADWSAYWLNDRELPRRPWVFDKQYAAVDTMLAATAPHFSDRTFPEEYEGESEITAIRAMAARGLGVRRSDPRWGFSGAAAGNRHPCLMQSCQSSRPAPSLLFDVLTYRIIAWSARRASTD